MSWFKELPKWFLLISIKSYEKKMPTLIENWKITDLIEKIERVLYVILIVHKYHFPKWKPVTGNLKTIFNYSLYQNIFCAHVFLDHQKYQLHEILVLAVICANLKKPDRIFTDSRGIFLLLSFSLSSLLKLIDAGHFDSVPTKLKTTKSDFRNFIFSHFDYLY